MTDILRVRVELDGSSPPIWRQVDLRADLPLDLVHLVLQTIFGWENRHLYRFSFGGGPFETGSHKLLCAEDIAEGDKGVPVELVSIGAVLMRPGARMFYGYDYGDSWAVTLELEKIFTALGPYPPVMVVAASAVVPAMGESVGKNNRESHCGPLLRFRETLQSLGLLRKHKGALLTTKVGLKARNDPAVLWQHVASRLVPEEQGSFERHATILLLTQAGGAADGRMNLEMAAAAMDAFGWRLTDHDQVPTWLFHRLPAHDVLKNVSDRPRSFRDWDAVSPAAAALARAALRR